MKEKMVRQMDNKMTKWHVSTAAEAIVAAQFARCGWDVSVQYGANQPEYDLMVSKGSNILKVSVKGSQDGSWGLTQGLLKKVGNTDYKKAAESWLKMHSKCTVLCLVQFKDYKVNQMPYICIATPEEVANQLKKSKNNNGDSILHLNKFWSRGIADGTTDKIPTEWEFSEKRIQYLASKINSNKCN